MGSINSTKNKLVVAFPPLIFVVIFFLPKILGLDEKSLEDGFKLVSLFSFLIWGGYLETIRSSIKKEKGKNVKLFGLVKYVYFDK